MLLADLLPKSLFAPERAEWLLWVLCVAAIPMLVFGADRLVGSAVKLARSLGMSTVLIGATVVSLGTTTPEAVVSVRAAIRGLPGLALGNGVGSIICDTALVFGLCCVLTRLPLDRFVLNRHGWIQLGAGGLLTATALILWAVSGDINDVWIPRYVGILFLVLLGVYLFISVRWARKHPEIVSERAAVQVPRNHLVRQAIVCLIFLVVGLALVVLGSEVLIGSVAEICRRRNLSEAVLAVALVALGTSLPELVTGIASIVKGHPGLLVGNIIGADILNVLFVIGASAAFVPSQIGGTAIKGLHVEPRFFQFILPVMMLVLIQLRFYIFINHKTFRRWQGVPLLVLYAAFIVVLVTAFGAQTH